jgi:hypothetical protein
VKLRAILPSGKKMKRLPVLPIIKGMEDLAFDAASVRLYASCDGDVPVYLQNTADNYKLLDKVPACPLARNRAPGATVEPLFCGRAAARNHKHRNFGLRGAIAFLNGLRNGGRFASAHPF